MTIAVGDTVPVLERTIGLTDMVAYAGATWDWHKLHYDAAYVAEKKLPGPIVDGQVYGALLVEMLQDWLGPQSFVHELEFTFRNLVFAGETLRCGGVVTSVDAERPDRRDDRRRGGRGRRRRACRGGAVPRRRTPGSAGRAGCLVTTPHRPQRLHCSGVPLTSRLLQRLRTEGIPGEPVIPARRRSR